MSDLIKRLSASCYLAFEDGTNDYSAAQEAIDRIEELVKERDGYLAERNKFQLYLQRTHADLELEVATVDALNAKLTKAMEALRNTLDKPRDADQSYAGLWADTIKEVRAALAELEVK